MRPVKFYKGVSLHDMPARARERADQLLQQVKEGETLTFPLSRPMPRIGPRCHELRVDYRKVRWRIVYRTDTDAILVIDLFIKKDRLTPERIIGRCISRLAGYDSRKANGGER